MPTVQPHILTCTSPVLPCHIYEIWHGLRCAVKSFHQDFLEKTFFFSMGDRLFFHNYYCLYNIPFEVLYSFCIIPGCFCVDRPLFHLHLTELHFWDILNIYTLEQQNRWFFIINKMINKKKSFFRILWKCKPFLHFNFSLKNILLYPWHICIIEIIHTDFSQIFYTRQS